MTKVILTAFLSCSVLTTFAQSKADTQPFILKGQITEYTNKHLFLVYQGENGIRSIDTIPVSEEGKFFYTTNKIHKPLPARINSEQIYIAPGYELNLTANGKDHLSFFKSKKISGIGAESNQYLFMLDSIRYARMDTVAWYNLEDERKLLQYIENNQKLQDSVAHIVFDKKASKDKYLGFFGKISRWDNEFQRLYMLLVYLNIRVRDYSKYSAFIKNNYDDSKLNNLYRDEYLLSNYYRSLIASEYVDYLVKIDYAKDSTLRKRKGYDFEKINATYKGKVKEFVLYSKMSYLLSYYCKSFKTFNEYKERFEPYIESLQNEAYKNELFNIIVKTEANLKRTQAGKPAPAFTMESDAGKTYSLSDFKGKVVYLDLWASWCGPCRAETPHFKNVYEKYKNNSDIAFISISLDDDHANWRKALTEDNPGWLQLIDKERMVSTAYVANTIPQFVLIDKKGNIVDFDAPRPSEGDKLIRLLDAELQK
jgi:thiol-disulfide isomerase/thioredoxin